MPKVSVIVPTHQHGHFVGEAIKSVLAQSYKDYEIIVVDDGSTDNTAEVLAAFENKIKIVTHPKSKGVAAARNSGIQLSHGELLAFLDADDVWTPDKLEKQVPLFDTNKGVGLVYSDIYHFDESGRLPGTSFEWAPPISGSVHSNLFVQSPIPMSTVMIRRTCVKSAGEFDETLNGVEDNDLWLRISKDWEIDYVNQAFAGYRRSANQLSLNREQMLIQHLRRKEKAFSVNASIRGLDVEKLDRGLYNHYLKLAGYYINLQKGGKARQVLFRYLKTRGVTRRFLGALAASFLPKRWLDLLLKIKKIAINDSR